MKLYFYKNIYINNSNIISLIIFNSFWLGKSITLLFAFAAQVTEIMAISTEMANEGYQFVPVYTVAAIFYWALAIIIELIFHKLEHHTTHYLVS